MQIQKQQTMHIIAGSVSIQTVIPHTSPLGLVARTVLSPAIKLHPSHTQQVATGALTFCPQFIVQTLQGVGRVPLLQGEPSKHSASHRELHLSTVTHPILYPKQVSLTVCLAPSLFSLAFLPLHLLLMWTRISLAWPSGFVWMGGNKRGLRAWAKEGGESKKERGRCEACSRRMENKRQYHFLLAGFPVGLNWGRVQQKVDS